jgi:DNA polymerase-3 subunit delta'
MRDVIGQRRVLSKLGARAARGDVAHTYGLFGPRSIGKRTVALRLAQTLQCERGDVPGGCGTCLACRKIERGVHPDVRIFTRAPDKTVITIEQMREVRSDLALRPLEGRKRVVIVDDAAELHDHAQDALLKTLEEPPSHAVLLLLSTTPSKLHETIRSRVQPLAFRLVPTSEIAEGLDARGVADPSRYAAAAAGRPGLAIALASGDPARVERAAVEAELYRLVASGLTDRFAWAADLNDLPDDAEHGRRRTAEIRRRFEHWSELLRDAAVAARGELARPLRPERSAETRALAAGAGATDLLDAALLVERLRRDLAFTANARAMLELFALTLPYTLGVKTQPLGRIPP